MTKEKIISVQNQWAEGIIEMGKLSNDRLSLEIFTSNFLDEMYDFENHDVLFKPTKASVEQFRPTLKMALSYFLGGDDSFCSEDDGFAMKPWVEVNFKNSGYIIEDSRAIAMGNYFFIDDSDNEVKVEFTFGYKLYDGKLVIDLHHSSLPFSR